MFSTFRVGSAISTTVLFRVAAYLPLYPVLFIYKKITHAHTEGNRLIPKYVSLLQRVTRTECLADDKKQMLD